jgi:hypothetical protein
VRRRRNEVEERRIVELLARLGRRVPPPPEDKLRAMARSAVESPRVPPEAAHGRLWRPFHVRWALAVAAALLLGSGFGFGVGTRSASDGAAGTSATGFGFLPAEDWTVVQSGRVASTGTANAIAANVPLDPDTKPTDLPYATLRSLPGNGAVIMARVSPRGDERRDSRFPLDALPLRLSDAETAAPPTPLMGARLVSLRLRGSDSGYNIDARIFLGAAPSRETAAAVDAQLRRLVVAPSAVTLVVQPTVFRSTGERMTIFGSVSSGEAGKKVTIQFKACGLYPPQFRDVFETTTDSGGGYSLAGSDSPFNRGVGGVFRAVSGDSVSAEVRVQQRPFVRLRPLRRGRFEVGVSGTVPFWRKYVVLERFDRRRGVWVKGRRLVLTEQGGGGGSAPPFQSVPSVNTASEPFRPMLPKGTTFRVVLPLSQARPCYLAGYSDIRQT